MKQDRDKNSSKRESDLTLHFTSKLSIYNLINKL